MFWGNFDHIKPLDQDTLIDNITHKLAAGMTGCLSAKATGNSCEAGSIGAIIGEMWGDYQVDNPNTLSPDQQDTIINQAKLIAGITAAFAGEDVTVAVGVAAEAVRWNSSMMYLYPDGYEILNDEDGTYAKEQLEAIKYTLNKIAEIHQYYNDMTIINFSVGMVSYTTIVNNKNGNVWVTGVLKRNDNGKEVYIPVSEVGINANIKTMANAIQQSPQSVKVTRPVGWGVSINFGSIKGGKKNGDEIDKVIEGSSVGVQVCHYACGGVIRTKSKDTIFTYGLGASQVGITGGNMVKLSEVQKQQWFKISGVKP